MKKVKIIKKTPKPPTKRVSLPSSQPSDYPSQSNIISPEEEEGLPDIKAPSSRSQFPIISHNYADQSQYPGQYSSIPVNPQTTYLRQEEEEEDGDLPDISPNLPAVSANLPANSANLQAQEEEEELPDISFNSSSNFPPSPPNFTIPSFNIQNIPIVASTVYTSNDFQGNSYIANEDLDLPDISSFSQNPANTEDIQSSNYSNQLPEITPPDINTLSSINGHPKFKKVSGLVSIQEEAEEDKEAEKEEEIEKEPEEVVKNKRIIIDLPLTLKCRFCERQRFESDFFPMHFGEEKEAICKMCWNINMFTAKKEKIPILNECSTCDELKHRYFGEKICPNNCIVCEDCQYCYIFNCKIRNRKEESCAFCDRKLVDKEQPWTLVA